MNARTPHFTAIRDAPATHEVSLFPRMSARVNYLDTICRNTLFTMMGEWRAAHGA